MGPSATLSRVAPRRRPAEGPSYYLPSRIHFSGRTGAIIDVRTSSTARHEAVPVLERRPPGRLSTLSMELAGASPLGLLRSAPGARGFWARGERWVAHAGVVASVEAEPGPDRFAEVRRATAIATPEPGPSWPAGADPRLTGRPRFFGGFSFQDEPGPSHLWVGFPPALFHLPAIELEGDAEGIARLHVRALARDGEPEAALRERLEERMRELAARLRATEDEAPEAGSTGARGSELRSNQSDRGAWDVAVERTLDAIRRGWVRKVVLARTVDVPHHELDPLEVLAQLWWANRDAHSHVFYFEPRPGRVMLGAAPETIATVRRGVFHATAVAGSIRRGASDGERTELAARLLASEKDLAEHRIAVEDMVERLERFATSVWAEEEPHVLALPAIQHLETEIRARLEEGTTVVDALAALHPTPAVCGEPRDAALELLGREEPFERGWYAGPVGWFDLDGTGVFAPALRSAVLSESGWRLYAGAGIVAGSSADAEWIESGIKLEPVLRALRAAAGDPGGR